MRHLTRDDRDHEATPVLRIVGALCCAVILLLLRCAAFHAPSATGIPRSVLHQIQSEGEEVDLVEAALRLSPTGPSRRQRRAALAEIDSFAERVRFSLDEKASPRETLQAISDVLFRQERIRSTPDVEAPESLSLTSVLEAKSGSCVSLVILYLAVAHRLGLSLHAAAAPDHLFVRYDGDSGVLNVETLEGGRFLDDREYHRRHRMAEESIRRGAFMTPLPKTAVLAHFLSNRGVMAMKKGARRRARKDFDAALELFPGLAAAYYNRGLLYLGKREYEAALSDFTKTIEIHPLDAEAFNNRGLAHMKLGNLPAAEGDFREALRLHPGLREASRNLMLLEMEPVPD